MTFLIDGFTAGDDLDIERDVTDVVPTDPISQAWLTIKTGRGVVDASATIQKVITPSQVVGTGQIAQDGSVGNGNGTASMIFQLTHVDTATIGTALRYDYDIQVKTSSGKLYTAEIGTMLFVAGVTDATA